MKTLYLKEEQPNSHIRDIPRYLMQAIFVFAEHVFHDSVAILIRIEKNAYNGAV